MSARKPILHILLSFAVVIPLAGQFQSVLPALPAPVAVEAPHARSVTPPPPPRPVGSVAAPAAIPAGADAYYFEGQPIRLTPIPNELVISRKPDQSDTGRLLSARSTVSLSRLSEAEAPSEVWTASLKSGDLADRQAIASLPGLLFVSKAYQLLGNTNGFSYAAGVIAKPKSDASDLQVTTLVEVQGLCRPAQSVADGAKRFWSLTGCRADVNFVDAANRLAESGLFVYAEPDFVTVTHVLGQSGVAAQTRPAAPATAASPTSYAWHLTQIDAPDAWPVFDAHKQKTPVVAVIDSGVQLDHPDLQYSLLPGVDEVNAHGASAYDTQGGPEPCPTPNPYVPNYHGTAVAGVIAADAAQHAANDYAIGVAANRVRIIPVRFVKYDCNLPIETSDPTWLADGIYWAIGQKQKPDVINMSVGNTAWQSSQALNDAIQSAADGGIVLVAGSGNAADANLSYPASNQNVIAVGGTGTDDKWYGHWLFCESLFTLHCGSNYGTGLSLVAPMINIPSTATGSLYTHFPLVPDRV